MTEQKQPEALRLIAEWRNSMPIGVMRIWAADVRDELRRQHAEIEALQDDLAHKDDYAEQLGRELAKADSEAKELRAKLDQATVAIKDISNDNWPDAGINAGEYANLVLYELAAGARPQEASYTSVQLAEMILSDCGCSTNNASLLERVAKRIDRHSDTLSQPAPVAHKEPT